MIQLFKSNVSENKYLYNKELIYTKDNCVLNNIFNKCISISSSCNLIGSNQRYVILHIKKFFQL